MIRKVISGGQTGADRAGLDAAINCHVATGGWCPKGRRAEDPSTGSEQGGEIPGHYQLTETDSEDYIVRTEWNVRDSDATLLFSHGAPSGGSLDTAAFCARLQKPLLAVDLDAVAGADAVREILTWLKDAPLPDDATLNVAGSRESEAPGIYDEVLMIVITVLRSLGA